MQNTVCDMKAREASATIEWLVEMGADEIIGSEPVNRLVMPPVPKAPETLKTVPTNLSKPSIVRPSGIIAEYSSGAAAASPGTSDSAVMAAECTTLADIEQEIGRAHV